MSEELEWTGEEGGGESGGGDDDDKGGLSLEEREAHLQEIWDKANIGRPIVKPMTPQRIRMADVEPESIDWLWSGRIARGKFTVLDGDPGLGKSTMLLDVAARLSQGRPMPFEEHEREPEGVVLLSCEDGISDTTAPRLRAADANLDMIESLTTLLDPDGVPCPLSIPDHVMYVEEAVRDLHAGLVVIDPLVAFLADKVDNYRDQHVRRALRSLVDMAEQTGCAVVSVRHPSKNGGKAIHRGGGSIGIIGAARTGLYVARDPEDDGSSILAVTKTNIGRQPDAMKYTLCSDDRYDCARVSWEAQMTLSAEDLIAIEDANPDTKDALVEAVGFLREVLRYGRVPFEEIRRIGKERGILETDLKRAKRRLHLREFESRVDRKWSWEMRTEGNARDLPLA